MELVCISDTHKGHEKLDLPEGDVLIHAGDFTPRGGLNHVAEFGRWLKSYEDDYDEIIVVAGNHDFSFEDERADEAVDMLGDHTTYLMDDSVVIDGVKFYGTPWQPAFGGWAFNVERGERLYEYYREIPDNTDILVTHSPPHGALDKAKKQAGSTAGMGMMQGSRAVYQPVGAKSLKRRVKEVNPDFHIFGHIHEDGGKRTEKDGTVFINAAVVNRPMEVVNEPQVIKLEESDDEQTIA